MCSSTASPRPPSRPSSGTPPARASPARARARRGGRGRALIDQADGARGTRTMGVDAAARAARLPSLPSPPGPGRHASVLGASDRGGWGRGGQTKAAAVRRRVVATLPPSVDGPYDARVHLRRVFAESSVEGGEFRRPPPGRPACRRRQAGGTSPCAAPPGSLSG